MSAIVTALGPIFALILLGYLLKWFAVPERLLGQKLGTPFWPFIEGLTYYVLLPALLFSSLAKADLRNFAIGPIAMSMIGSTFTISAAALALRPWLGLSGPSFSSFFQGTIRPNTYVGLGPVFALWGSEGLTTLAIALLSTIPLVNVLSVIVVSRFSALPGARPPGLLALMRMLARNPLILACLLGALVSLMRVPTPFWLMALFDALGKAALPLGLLAVGAALDFAAVRNAIGAITLTSIFKLALFPAMTAFVAVMLGLSGTALGVITLYGGLPGAPSAYVLARQLGGDAALMAGMLTAATLAAFITLPMIILIVY